MKVRNDEGVVIHIGPEPCVGIREGAGEASAGERIGQPLSRDRRFFPGADAVLRAEGHTDRRANASAWTARRGRRPWHGRVAPLDGNRRVQRLTVGLANGPHREGEEP